jgi:CBS-domain-containing membrane protein
MLVSVGEAAPLEHHRIPAVLARHLGVLIEAGADAMAVWAAITGRRFPSEDTPAGEALARLEARGFGPVVVLNHAGVVMGAAYRDSLRSAGPGTAVKSVMRSGVSTVRPNEHTDGLIHRMRHADVTRVIVTRSDGTLVGLFFVDDAAAGAG